VNIWNLILSERFQIKIRGEEMEKYAIDRGLEKTMKKSEGEEEPMILEEIEIEDLFIDGICGVY
jgi:mycofactocin precursor